MITIQNLQELENYITDSKKEKIYIISDDVIFNTPLHFKEDYVIIKCKGAVFNYKVNINEIHIQSNLIAEDDVESNLINVGGDVSVKKLECNHMNCNNLVGEDVSSHLLICRNKINCNKLCVIENLEFKKLDIQHLYLHSFEFKNITSENEDKNFWD